MIEHTIYLNNSEGMPLSQGVIDAMATQFSQKLPNSKALCQIYAAIDASDEDTLVITSSGAEAINHVITSVYFDGMGSKEHLLVGSTSEAASVMACGRCESFGATSTVVPVNEKGIITAEAVREAMTPRTRLLSLPWVDGLTGVIHPIEEIVSVCRERGVLLHLDITHAIGKLQGNLQGDYITFDGAPFGAPVGTGAVLIRQGRLLSPMIQGGVEQAGFRAGGVNGALLAGLGQAAFEAVEKCDFVCTEVARLRDKLEASLVDFVGAQPLMVEGERLPNCTAMAFPAVCGEALAYALEKAKVAVSIGGGSFQQLKTLLKTCGVESSLANSALSFSLGANNTEEDVLRTVDVITEAVSSLRKLSEQIK